jgi:hypothetical protein
MMLSCPIQMRSQEPRATFETRQSAPRRLEEARTAATPPIRDLPPRDVVPLPRAHPRGALRDRT